MIVRSQYQIGDEDGDDGHRRHIADQEPQHAEDPDAGPEGAVVGEFVIDIRLLETPSHKDDSEEAAECHEDV